MKSFLQNHLKSKQLIFKKWFCKNNGIELLKQSSEKYLKLLSKVIIILKIRKIKTYSLSKDKKALLQPILWKSILTQILKKNNLQEADN
jgi:hypothetical protein